MNPDPTSPDRKKIRAVAALLVGRAYQISSPKGFVDADPLLVAKLLCIRLSHPARGAQLLAEGKTFHPTPSTSIRALVDASKRISISRLEPPPHRR